MPTFTSFRFHGDLRAVLGDTDAIQLPPGRIHILEHFQGETHRTFVAWQARDDHGDIDLTEAPNLHADPGIVHQALSDASNDARTSVAFSIGDPGEVDDTPTTLTFSGITALDRMSMHEDDPQLRLPCLPHTMRKKKHKKKQFDSSLVICGQGFDGAADATFDYAYQLIVPIPVSFGNDDCAAKRDQIFILGARHAADGADTTLHQSPHKHYVWQWSQTALLTVDGADIGNARFGDVDFGPRQANGEDRPVIGLNGAERPRPGALLTRLGISPDIADNTLIETNNTQKLSFHAVPGHPDACQIRVLKRVKTGTLIPQTLPGTEIKPYANGRNGHVLTKIETTIHRPDSTLSPSHDGWKAPLNADARLFLHWSSKARHLFGNEDPLALNRAIRDMAAARMAMHNIQSQPQSFLPEFEIHGFSDTDRFALSMRLGVDITATAEAPPRLEKPRGRKHVPVVLTIDDDHRLGGDASVGLRTRLPGIDHERRSGAASDHFHLRLVGQPAVLGLQPTTSRIVFGLDNDTDTTCHHSHDTSPPLRGRLGSLLFMGPTPPATSHAQKLLRDTPPKKPDSELDLRLRGPMGPHSFAAAPQLDLRVKLNLRLGHVVPVAADVPHGARDRPREDWLIPVEPRGGAGGTDTRFELEISEQLTAAQDRHLTATLKESSAQNGAGDVVADDVLVTQMPFGMMRLRRPPLSSLGTETNNDVAMWNSDTRQWQFFEARENVPIAFPAGAIGEAADKPGRLEMHDAAAGPAHVRNVPVRSRYSGSTTIWTDPRAFGRNFVTPIHNAHALFRARGEAGPGAFLSGFVNEVVYSLSTSWRVPPAQGVPIAPVRLAEAEALSGWTLSERVDSSASAITDRWPELHRALRDRPQHLEAVRGGASDSAIYPPARFDDNLTFVARNTAVLAPPMEDVATGSDADGLPGPRIRDHGLPGGAFWPIEQRGFLEAVLRNPVSNEGSLENFAIGPFGSSGSQVARFVNGSLGVISETRLGRLESLRVEVTGRIAAYWHHAKHVVVYRRTTAQSDQFEPAHCGDSRTTLPVLRKVQEYIELLEPVRCYPDHAASSTRDTGNLKEVRFASARINVDSAWSAPVGEGGWRIPLWQRRASMLRPAVYPMPGIVVATHGDGDEATSLTLQDCTDPHKMFFYTNADFAVRERDTDRWPAIIGIDCLPEAQAKEWLKVQNEASIKRSSDRNGARRPSASRYAPGLGAFTLRLAPTAGLSQINAGRSGSPIFAGLDSITFMRGTANKGSEAVPASQDALELPGALADAVTQIEQFVAHPETTALLQPVVQTLDAVKTALTGNPTLAEAKTLLKQYETALSDLRNDPNHLTAIDTALFDGKGKAHLDKLKTYKEQIKRVIEAEAADCEALKAQALTQVKAKKLLLLQNLAAVRGDLLQKIKDPDVVDIKKELNTSQKTADAIVDLTLQRVQKDVGDILAQVEDVRAIVQDWKTQVKTAHDKGGERLDAFRRAYRTDAPWSDSRMDQAEASLLAEIGNLEEEATAALSEARQRMASDISGAAADVTVTVDAALRRALAKLPPRDLAGRLEGFYKPVRDTLQSVQSAELRQKVDDALAVLDAHDAGKQVADPLRAAWQDLQTRIDTLNDWSTASKESLSKVIGISDALGDGAKQEITDAAQTAKDLVTQFEALAKGQLADLDDAAKAQIAEVTHTFRTHTKATRDALVDLSMRRVFDRLVDDAHRWISGNIAELEGIALAGLAASDAWLSGNKTSVEDAAGKVLEALGGGVKEKVIAPVFDRVKAQVEALPDLEQARAAAIAFVQDLSDHFEELYSAVEVEVLKVADALEELCKTLVGQKDNVKRALEDFAAWVGHTLGNYINALKKMQDLDSLQDIKDGFESLGSVFDTLKQQVLNVMNGSLTYFVRAIERAGQIAEQIGQEATDQILRLLASSGTIPDIGDLGIDTDRIAALFDPLGDLIDTSAARALLDRLGDALSSMKLDLPFAGLGDGFDLDFDFDPKFKLPKLDLPDVFPSFGGLDLKRILPDLGGASGLKKYVKVTHDVDKKAKRAWVKASVDVPFTGRHKMFALGPFTLFLISPTLTGWVRIEADGNTKDVTTTDFGEIDTDMEAVVTGQPLVTLRDVKIQYTSATGLDFKIDPKKIKLHPNFQFVQDFLSSLGLAGDNGIQLIKSDGIPVGIEHRFAIPPISLMYGTSGVSNIRIANRFSLRAYPDFKITDRFNLSDADQPFIFSIFVIGGAGYVELDMSYLPADGEMVVVVKAAVGGSASLGFSFGPVSGGVFVTLSVVMTYRRQLLGDGSDAEDGLAISLELVIAGYVSLWGIVTIYLGLMLSLTYRDNGQIDATGRLKVSVRISRFFKLKYATTVKYKLRNGTSSTTRTEEFGVAADNDAFATRANKLRNARAEVPQ